MRTKLLFVIGAMVAFMLLQSGCGNGNPSCPTCGTTTGGQYSVVDVMAVPEHNPTGEPGGPFNSFDISWVDTPTHRFYVSDRIGLDVPVFDTVNNVALFAIGGDNSVAVGAPGQFTPSPCDPSIPFTISALGNVTRFGCRTAGFHLPGFGASGDFGGFTGAQCCASRGNGVNPISCPCGMVVTADGKTLFVSNSSAAVLAFDLTTSPPMVLANIPVGQSADWDGPLGVAPCVSSWSGRAGSDPTCGDDRADEMSYDEKDKILLVDNGDPGLPFVTLIDMSGVVARTSHCLPTNPAAPYGMPAGLPGDNGLGTDPTQPANNPTCVIGQIYYDGGVLNARGTDSAGNPCPDPSLGYLAGKFKGQPVPTGQWLGISGGNVVSSNTCIHDNIAPAGLGGSAFIPALGHFWTTNPNNQVDPHFGTIDEVDPLAFAAGRPPIVRQITLPGCMMSGVVPGPGNDVLVVCAGHDGMAFPPTTFILDAPSGNIITTINNVGGVDEAWYNPGDNRYYLAARDMLGGPKLGVIDAGSRTWLVNVTTNSNSHSIAVDSSNNQVFVPMQAGGICGTQSGNGCVAIFLQQ